MFALALIWFGSTETSSEKYDSSIEPNLRLWTCWTNFNQTANWTHFAELIFNWTYFTKVLWSYFKNLLIRTYLSELQLSYFENVPIWTYLSNRRWSYFELETGLISLNLLGFPNLTSAKTGDSSIRIAWSTFHAFQGKS